MSTSIDEVRQEQARELTAISRIPGRGALVHEVGRRAGDPADLAGWQPRCPACEWAGPTVDLETAGVLAQAHRAEGC